MKPPSGITDNNCYLQMNDILCYRSPAAHVVRPICEYTGDFTNILLIFLHENLFHAL